MSVADLAAQDAAARRRAQLEFVVPLVLEAGAGTGKTATLVARILAWCLGPGWEKAARELPGAAADALAARAALGVVAITFTEAAAAEMAERVGAALAELARGATPVGFDRGLTGLDDAPLAQRAAALLSSLDRLEIATIHAFCARLLAQHPLEAGLHPSFEVDAEGELLELHLSAVLEDQLRRAYGEPGDRDALRLAAEGYGPRELAEAARALLENGVPATALATPRFDRAAAERLRGELAAAVTAVRKAGGESLTAVAGRSRTTAPAAAAILALDELALAADHAPEEALAELVSAVSAGIEAHAGKLKAWAAEGFNKTEGDLLGERAPALRSALGELWALLRRFTALDPLRFEAARRLLTPLVAETARRLDHAGAVSYQALLTRAAALLGRHRDLAALCRRRMDQLLVDEFQDTNRLQCDLVRLLALEGPAEQRPGLFLVGDPKQSIYGFRNADLGAYDDFVAEVLAAGGCRERLSVNFRSLPSILVEVERLIAPVMVAETGVQPPFEPLLPSAGRSAAALAVEAALAAGGRAPVEHWISWRPGEGGGARTPVLEAAELEARALARDLLALRAESALPWKEVALLLRSRSDLPTYVRALEEAGIPYSLARDRSYFRRREILDAAALVRTILDPADHLALVTVLRAPWVGVPDAALPRLWQRGLPRQMAALGGASPEGFAELAALATEVARELAPLASEIPGLAELGGWEGSLLAFARALAELRCSFAADPADLFVDKLRSQTLLEASEAARFLGAWRLANLERFFERLVTNLDRGADVEGLLRFLRRAVEEARETQEGRSTQDLDDAVQVLTIHAAKGLDFGHVYLVQAHKKPRLEGAASSAAREVGEGWELLLLDAPSPGWGAEQERLNAARRAEQVRLLYVALTRAKDRLVVAGVAPAKAPEGALEGAPASAAKAASFADLLALRRPPPPRLPELLTELVQAGADARVIDGARWVFPALAATAGVVPAVAGAAPRFDLPALTARFAASEATRAARLAGAAARAARPLAGPASAGAHHELEELFRADEARRDAVRNRDAAQELGTAFHRALESIEAGAPLPPAESPELGELLASFWSGELGRRFRALLPHLVARELPVLLPPQPDRGPLGAIAGAIDLVYRDPATGALVVADYKTDDVRGEELAARARAYAQQGALYCRALQEALNLSEKPRFELWFVRAGVVWAG